MSTVHHSSSSEQLPASTSAQQPRRTRRELFTGCLSQIDSEAVAEMQDIALDIAKALTNAAADVSDSIPVPGLKAGLLALVKLITKLQDMKTVVKGVTTLQERVRSLSTSLNDFSKQLNDQQLPGGMAKQIGALAQTWEDIAARAEKIKSRGRILRFLRSTRDAKQLGDLIGEINDSIQDKIVVQGVLNIEKYIQGIYENMKHLKAFVDASFISTYAKTAHYNSNQVRRSCLEGTRVGVLQHTRTWITDACTSKEEIPSGGIVLWINGLGGTGKTTVAVSAAEWCDDQGLLGGTFFCSHSDNECNNPNLIFVTLCRQLCQRHAGFNENVQTVLRENPDIVNCGPYIQFEQLILRPLEQLEGGFPRLVIVLDALDECRDENTTSTILSVIAKYATRIAKFLLFIITSRPEQRITALFDAKRQDSLKDKTTPLLLHDIPIEIVEADIRLYLNHEFEQAIGFLSIVKGWPSTEEKNALARQSRGLFIYVATAIKFILDTAYRDPKGQMHLLLTRTPDSSAPHEFLFALYSRILDASHDKVSPKLAQRLRDVVGAIVLAQEPLSATTVAGLVGLDVAAVRNTLTRLHSVLYVPVDDHQPIRIIHPTFPEFLLHSPAAFASDTISATPRIQPAMQHWHLFSRCIIVMGDNLKRDMINIRHPATFRDEVENFQDQVSEALKPHVSYACRFWGYHLRDGIGGAVALDDSAPFDDFVGKDLLYWLEACSLLGAIDKAISALVAARNACQVLGGRFADLTPVLEDCSQLLAAYSPCIHTAPLQVYHSVLGIAPTCSIVRKMYAREYKHSLVVDHGAPADWGPCLDTFPGHGGFPVITVEFSPDGSRFVTGSENNQATVWDTATRTPIVSFDEHKGRVLCVIFAPDGLHVASGSDDTTVRVWNASSGECLHTLEGHGDWVNSVVYSGDGKRILSATYTEGEMKLWDTTEGSCLRTLVKTSQTTIQAAISFDGGVIARGEAASVRLYAASSSTTDTLEFPDDVLACAFSPDGSYIAARSARALRVWTFPDKSLVRSVDTNEDLYSRLAFSHDGTIIGCGLSDGSLCSWQAASGSPPHVLQGRASKINDISYSPDRSQVVSVTHHGVIQLWSLTSSATTLHHLALPPVPLDSQVPDHTSTTTPSTIASAPQTVVAPSADTHPRDWRFPNTRQVQVFGLFSGSPPFAVSSDSSQFACPSLTPGSSQVVTVSNTRTGMTVATLTGHAGPVTSIVFSPDNLRLATGSIDSSVKVWDAQSGAFLCGHTQHQNCTLAVAFSFDGRLVASCSYDDGVCIFDTATGQVTRILGPHRPWYAYVVFATDNVHLVGLTRTDYVHVWDITTGACVREFNPSESDQLHSPLFSSDCTGIVLQDDQGVSRTVSLWAHGAPAHSVYDVKPDGWVYTKGSRKVQRLCWLPPEWREAQASYEGTICVREARSGRDELGRLVFLNVSNLLEYIESLDTELQPDL